MNKNLNLEVKKITHFLKKKKGSTDLKITRNSSSDIITIIPAEFQKSVPVKTRTIILAVNEDETLENALIRALAPDDIKIVSLLEKNLRNMGVNKETCLTGGSAKYKKSSSVRISGKKNISYSKGIYLIRIDSKLKVNNVKKVDRVLLDPRLYQNAEYIGNSYFSKVQVEKR